MTTIAPTDERLPRRAARSSFHFILALFIATLVFTGFGTEAGEFFLHSTLHYPLVYVV